MKTTDTFTANIMVGFREGYGEDKPIHTMREAEVICQNYCDDVGLCVTLTPTTFVYTNGSEPGCIIGLINYPRFPNNPKDIISRAIILAEVFLKAFHQERISVVTTEQTYMIEN